MRQINLTPREARMLRDTLEGDAKGYDHLELKKLEWMAKKLTGLMGNYGIKMEVFASEEKRIRRSFLRGQITQQSHDESLNGIRFDVEDLNDEADKLPTQPWLLEEADYKLVSERINENKWFGTREARPIVLGMLQALEEAPQIEPAVAVPTTEPTANGKAHKRVLELVEA